MAKPFAVRCVDVKYHVDETLRRQRREQRAARSDSVGHQRRSHPERTDAGDNCQQLVAIAKCRIATGDLNIGVLSVMAENEIDAAEDFLERHILDRLGVFREITKRAVEIATLSYFQRDAANGPTQSHLLPGRGASG